MQFINSIIAFFATKHPNQREILKLRFYKFFKNKLANLLNAVSFWLALKQIFAIWKWNFSLLLIATPKRLTSSLPRFHHCIFLSNYVHTLFQKRANGIYQCLASNKCFQINRSEVLTFFLIYLEHFQVSHRKQKRSCHQQNYKYSPCKKKKRSFK